MTSIDVRELLLRRKVGRNITFVLGPLSFSVRAKSRTALIGPSGCGKTSLLRCLAGLETPDTGAIQFGDRVVQDGRITLPPSARHIGFVFQDAALWPHLSAAEHIRFVDPGLSTSEAAALLGQVGLGDQADQRPGALSGGEGQRLALARALAGDPELLLLDEPLHSVDVPLRDELSLLIRKVCEDRGLTLLVVTHDRDEALAMADELVILREGRVVETGSVREVLREPKTAFGAALICGAACLPATRREDGAMETVFGIMRGAESRNSQCLVVLPGDVIVAAEGNEHPRGQVLQVLPAAEGAMATVELAGQTLRVPCALETLPGCSLPLTLRHEPRFLPLGEVT